MDGVLQLLGPPPEAGGRPRAARAAALLPAPNQRPACSSKARDGPCWNAQSKDLPRVSCNIKQALDKPWPKTQKKALGRKPDDIFPREKIIADLKKVTCLIFIS